MTTMLGTIVSLEHWHESNLVAVYRGDNKGLKRSVRRVYNLSLQMTFGKCAYKSQKSRLEPGPYLLKGVYSETVKL